MIGYFATSTPQPRIDLGPAEGFWTTAAERGARHEYDKGVSAMLELARRPSRPELPMAPDADPALKRYQESMQYLSLRDPSVAARLQQEAAIMGRMADLRAARGMFGRKPPGVAGLGYVMIPAVPPGHSYAELAWIGSPTRLARAGRNGIF